MIRFIFQNQVINSQKNFFRCQSIVRTQEKEFLFCQRKDMKAYALVLCHMCANPCELLGNRLPVESRR